MAYEIRVPSVFLWLIHPHYVKHVSLGKQAFIRQDQERGTVTPGRADLGALSSRHGYLE
jgi:hypothetical protein